MSAPSRRVLLALGLPLAVLGAGGALLVPRLGGEPASSARPATRAVPAPVVSEAAPATAPETDTLDPGRLRFDTVTPLSPPPPADASDAPTLVEGAGAAETTGPAAPRLPVASRWSLPPIMTLTAPGPDPVAGRRGSRSAALALAPAVVRALGRGADPSALAPLARLPRSDAGPILVLALQRRTVRAQATSLAGTRAALRALLALPEGQRPAILLESAPEDVADQSGPPPPRAGELATLVPIYQAAGSEYGIDWRILAAINLVETGLGTNTNVSSAGAVGWMQFMPATWRAYGRDASGDGIADPRDPYDAIYSAARYLEAAGARRDLGRAIFAYNHADWYVRMVLEAARNLPAPFAGAD